MGDASAVIRGVVVVVGGVPDVFGVVAVSALAAASTAVPEVVTAEVGGVMAVPKVDVVGVAVVMVGVDGGPELSRNTTSSIALPCESR